jgi:hypothetical protein
MTAGNRLYIWRAAAVLAAALSAGAAGAADWKPADGPLMTRWAKDVKPDNVLPEYPRPQLRRAAWMNLNGVWQLAFAKEGEDAPVGKDLPERILVPFPVESALSGVMKPAERLWYRRTFAVPTDKDWKDKRVLLHFGAVDWEATVWLNGKKLGDHRGGYDGFTFDVTDALKKDGDQELIVGVYDPTDAGTQPRGKQVNKPEGIYYTPTTGIWQTVWLEPVPKASIESLTIVPDVDAGKVRVTVHGLGTTAAHKATITIRTGKESSIEFAAPLEKPVDLVVDPVKLWSPEQPFLYDLDVALTQKGESVDRVNSYFGMRKVEVAPTDGKGPPRVLVNGKATFLRGPLDQGFWPDGLYTAPTDEALKYDIEMTKQLGFNMTRKHVKVEPDRWYYWCDKLGLLVWQDMPSGDKSIGGNDPDLKRTPESAKQYEQELKAMIDGRGNHPSIMMWVVFNEGWGQFDTARITEWTKQYDPTRLVDCASGWADRGVGDVIDAHVYPGPGAPAPEDKRASVLGEFGGLGLGVDGHTWAKKTWGYQGTKSQDDLTHKYERLWQRAWKLKDDKALCAAVYTQLTDVETEANGLMTYDRAVVKVDAERAAAAAQGDFSNVPEPMVLLPTSQEKGQTWRYVTEWQDNNWFKPEYKDGEWKQGEGGFGTKGTPGAVVRTEWNKKEIYLRREVDLPEGPYTNPVLLMHHDEDAEVYINGVLAAKVSGYITNYEETSLTPEGAAALKPGKKNLIAVHCRQTTGGQYIDVGLLDLKPAKGAKDKPPEK